MSFQVASSKAVALARAITPKPQLLLDEPYFNLDVDLRQRWPTRYATS